MIGREARPRQEAGDGGDVEDAAAVAGDAVDETQRQIGERAHVEVDQLELIGDGDVGGFAEHAEAGIVDEV